MFNYKGAKDFERFSRTLKDSFERSLKPITVGRMQPARLGNPDTKKVIIPPAQRVQGCSLWAYFDVDQTRQIVQVANTNASITFDNSNYGLPVKLAKPNGASVYHIMSADENQLNEVTNGVLPAQVAQKRMMPLVPSRWQELQPQSNSSLVVGVTGGPVRIDGTMYYLEDDDAFIDLSSYVPSTSGMAKYVVVSYNGSSAVVTESSEFSVGVNAGADYLPTSIASGQAPLFAVYLFNSQTSIEKKHFIPLKTFHQTFTGDSITLPGSSTDNAIVRFDGTTGATIQNSGVTIDDSDLVSGVAKLTLTDSATIGVLNITPRSTAPSSPATNDIYLDDGTNHASASYGFRYWDGAAWNDL